MAPQRKDSLPRAMHPDLVACFVRLDRLIPRIAREGWAEEFLADIPSAEQCAVIAKAQGAHEPQLTGNHIHDILVATGRGAMDLQIAMQAGRA